MNESEENRNERIGISLAGAVDLSGLKAKSGKARGDGEEEKGGDFSYVLDVSFASLESYAPASATYPILLLIYGAESVGFAGELARAVEEEKGKLQLLRIDASKDPDEAAAVDPSSLPALFAMIKGKLLPLFEGPLDVTRAQEEELARGSVEAALEAAAEDGVTGTAPKMGKAKEPEAGGGEAREDGLYRAAEKFAKEGEFDRAAEEFKKIAEENPGDREAEAKAAEAALIARVKKTDPASVRERAAKDSANLSSQLEVADLDVYEGHVEDAIGRLLDCIASGIDKEGKARERILSYISMLPAADPRAKSARTKLACLLY
ncbi:MAG: tetratricopeptide repeat protein [Aeriscardovia sp.]|nr:tetratricopeptide repeat protein [Aeriscardovia sp.]